MFKIVKMRGGMGNQMFIYTFYLALKKKSPFSIINLDILDSWFAHNSYDIFQVFKLNKKSSYKFYRWQLKIYSIYFTRFFFKIIKEDNEDFCSYNPKYLDYNFSICVYDGFWQSEKYFKSIETDIKSKFQFNLSKLNMQSRKFITDILNSNSVSIHIRRGDYLNHVDQYGGICTEEYYKKSISYLESKDTNLFYYIFSDDTEWVKKNLMIEKSIIINCNLGEDSWQDMCLMSNCKHNIIANSTFSWWGAWLNNNPNKIVISPIKWVNGNDKNDIIPNSWIKL